MTPRETVEEWLFGIRVEIPAHYGAAKIFERYQALLDWPTILCTSITATAFVSTMAEVDGVSVLKIFAVLLSIAGTVLSTTGTAVIGTVNHCEILTTTYR